MKSLPWWTDVRSYRRFFDYTLEKDPRFFAFGEDVGKIGDVNQAFSGLQAKYGEMRVSDTGIRECTIIGQGIGTALRGLRPVAEINTWIIYFMDCRCFLMTWLPCFIEPKVVKKLL